MAAAPLITDAGMVLISGGNTSPALTSDLAGNPGNDYSVGYYRTAYNDLYQGVAMAEFAFSELGLSTAAAIHDGDPYTQALARAFADAFEAAGGTVTGFTGINRDDTDMVPALTEIAADRPDALFFPIFHPAADFVAAQAPTVQGLQDTILMAADGLLNTNFLGLLQSAGMSLSGPDNRFGTNVNQSTGKTADDFLAVYEQRYGEIPAAPFWAHSYDATTLLLDAIKAASWLEDGNLMIDRQGVRTDAQSTQSAVRGGYLEEIFLHEAAHAALDPMGDDAGWRSAQEADGAFISGYARDFPDREDIAESFLPYFALRHSPDRLTTAQRWYMMTTIPNRLAYFDEQHFDLPIEPPYDTKSKIRGTLVGPDGQPLGDILIWAWSGNVDNSGHAYTRHDGTFAISVPDGRFTLDVYAAADGSCAGWYDGASVTNNYNKAVRIGVEGQDIDGITIRLPALPQQIPSGSC